MADKKALFRAKLAQRNQKRIENPLVRYNDHDQPVCRVCDVVLKSETDWTVHQTSRKHKVAIDTLKANSATLKQTINANVERPKDSHRAKFENHEKLHSKGVEPSMGLSKPRQTSSLPPNFFDSKETKKQKSAPTTESRDFDKFKHTEANVQSKELQSSIPSGKVDIKIENTDSKSSEFGPSKEQISTMPLGSETRKAKGLIPEGFYDNKDADLRARGITPIKLDVKDEYKEFEKLIQEDLQQVDKRLEEEEYDAADMIEEAETVEQRAYKERVEMLKKRKMELKAGKSTLRSRATPPATAKESTVEEESSSGTDSDDEILTVDWRAKHL